MPQAPISAMTDGAPALSGDRLEISRETSPGVWETRSLDIGDLGALINAVILAGASAGLDTFAEAETILAGKVAKAGDVLSGPLELAPSVDVASAATTDIGAVASNLVRITGTTTITALGVIAAGALRFVRFADRLILTHDAVSLILPRARNIQTAANDFALFVSEGAGHWRCLFHVEALKISDPAAVVRMVDEFMFGSGESGELGDMGWSITNGSAALTTPESNHPGVLARTSGAVAGQIASMYTASAGTVPVIRFDQCGDCHWVIAPNSAGSDGSYRFGFSSDLTTETPVQGFYFERKSTDANWFGVSRAASAETRVDTGVVFAAAWTTLRLRRIDAATVGFSVNGGAEVTITTNIPSASHTLAIGNQLIPSAAAAVTVRMDAFSLASPGPVR